MPSKESKAWYKYVQVVWIRFSCIWKSDVRGLWSVYECLSFVRMYAVVFSTAAGSGQLVLTNLSQMAQAIGYSSQSEALLCNFSFCSLCSEIMITWWRMKDWHGNASKRKTNCIGSPITAHMTLDCVHCMLDACPVVCLLLSPGQVITRQECICLIFVDHILTHSQQRAKWNKHIHDSILCGLVCDLPNMYKISCVTLGIRNAPQSDK